MHVFVSMCVCVKDTRVCSVNVCVSVRACMIIEGTDSVLVCVSECEGVWLVRLDVLVCD